MLPRENRIKKRKDFDSIFREGKASFGRFFILKVTDNNFSFPRFAFVFPIKNEKSAVQRNKGKRIFRESVRYLLPLIKRNIDGIFILKRDANQIDYSEIKEDVEKVFKKEKII